MTVNAENDGIKTPNGANDRFQFSERRVTLTHQFGSQVPFCGSYSMHNDGGNNQ